MTLQLLPAHVMLAKVRPTALSEDSEDSRPLSSESESVRATRARDSPPPVPGSCSDAISAKDAIRSALSHP